MIKVYVVDDERLVRRGIIGLIDWSKYGMAVVGDSGSGEEALKFIRENEVDLLFSDLEMPGLSGIPFLQAVKKVKPKTGIVVLTMHQEFELIQQALRIGILDYITKAQIEEENVDAFMEGVRKRYLDNVRRAQLEERKIETGEVYVWITNGKKEQDEVEQLLLEKQYAYEILCENHIMLSGDYSSIGMNALVEGSGIYEPTLTVIKQVRGVQCSRLAGTLQSVLRRRMFADRKPGCHTYTYIYQELTFGQADISRKELLELCTKMEFMVNDDFYVRVTEQIKNADLSPEERSAVFYQFNLFWSDFSGKDFSCYFEEIANFRWWYQWSRWFDNVRSLVKQRVGQNSEEIAYTEAIHKAMNYIREHMDREITLEELLRLTGMSKSHFSKHFKRITGKTFVTYLNDMRIESAKKYLTETKQSIYWIARQVGYTDEHYFRRIFKERTGENPKSYRENS